MPFYQITIILKNNEVISGVRETENLHIDPVFMEYFIKANQHYHHENITKFSCVMISRHSQEYRDYEASRKKPEPMDPVYKEPNAPVLATSHAGGKYRNRKEAPEGPGWGELKMRENKNK